jgi:DNA-binding transcriptional regulator YiaG
MNTKIEKKFVYKGLGFPIMLTNVPLKKVMGEWVLNIDMNKLQSAALFALVHKPSGLTGSEIHFIRTHFQMTMEQFGKLFGVSHVSVVKWENNLSIIQANTEKLIRLYVYDQLRVKNNEFREFFHLISKEKLPRTSINKPLEINA